MAERGLAAAGLAVLWSWVGAASPAVARVQEYQIVRLITFKSECQIAKLEDRSLPSGPMRFVASCENVGFYPDGIEVICPDRDDDRSCRVTTKAKSFDNLHLLDPGR